jgi:alpha-mannosidase
MHDDRSEVEARVAKIVRERIAPALHAPGVPLEVSAFMPEGEPVPLATAQQATYEPFEIGTAFGPPWSTTWFRMRGEVPADWSGRPVDAVVQFATGLITGFSTEALVFVDGVPVQGLHREHRRVPIGRPAKGGEVVDLLVETASNPDVVISQAPTPMGDRATAPQVPITALQRAELAPFHEDVWHLSLDVQVLTGLMISLPLDDGRRHQILRALERMVEALDPRDVGASAATARAELADVLARPANASAHRVSAIGHAHLDTAWLWPLRETHRKVARTFANAVQIMDEYPEYLFAGSQAQHYAWLRDDQPDLWARVKERVADGRFVPVGGMWVECDGNLPSGESIVRQLVHGKRFFADELGVEPTEVWIPDVFGYPASLPQIFRQAGCTRFVTQKMSWNDTNTFPHHTFDWEGVDGSRVRAHFPPTDTYNGTMLPAELIVGVRRFREHGRAERSLYPFGYGDGGGGPTREMLELARRQRDLESAPRVTIETPSAFFDRLEEEDPDPPVWVGELYLEKHRGTYTTQARTKAGNRRCEWLLREAELWTTAAALANGGAGRPSEELDALWKETLLHQFHDILPGSGIAWVHHDAEAAHARIAQAAERIAVERAAEVAAGLDAPLALANALTHDRAEVTTLSRRPPGGEPVQALADGGFAAFVEVPGLAVVPARPARPPGTVTAVCGPTTSPGVGRLENDLLRVEVDGDGLLTSVWDKVAEREVLRPGERGNVLRLHPDQPNEFDAWDISRRAYASATELTGAEVVRLVEPGPLVGSIRTVRAFGSSRVVQEYVLRAGSRRLDVVTEVDWHEEEMLLDVVFPVDVHAPRARYEIQFGSVERPTHRNTSWDWAQFEVCGHSWADLSEPDYGVAVLTDAKYGYEVAGAVMRITLLRAPRYPDPTADQGAHRFTYSLFPHQGDHRDGGVVAAAHALNAPLREVVPASGVEETPASARRVLAVDHPGVVVSAVKPADDDSGDVVVRCYEAWGQRAHARLAMERAITRAVTCDVLERPDGRGELALRAGAARLALRPFEIATVRLEVAS